MELPTEAKRINRNQWKLGPFKDTSFYGAMGDTPRSVNVDVSEIRKSERVGVLNGLCSLFNELMPVPTQSQQNKVLSFKAYREPHNCDFLDGGYASGGEIISLVPNTKIKNIRGTSAHLSSLSLGSRDNYSDVMSSKNTAYRIHLNN